MDRAEDGREAFERKGAGDARCFVEDGAGAFICALFLGGRCCRGLGAIDAEFGVGESFFAGCGGVEVFIFVVAVISAVLVFAFPGAASCGLGDAAGA